MNKKMKKVVASINGGSPEELVVYDSDVNIIEKDGRLYDTVWDMYVDEFEDYEPNEDELLSLVGQIPEEYIRRCSIVQEDIFKK